MLVSKTSCPDCGFISLNHTSERWIIIINLLLQHCFKIFELPRRKISPLIGPIFIDQIGPILIWGLTKIGFGKIVTKNQDSNATTARCLYEEANRRGINFYEFHIAKKRDLFVAQFKNETRCFERLPRPAGKYFESNEWMANKWIVKKKLKRMNLPVARGKICLTLSAARCAFKFLEKPLITKPHLGSGSRHTTIHLNSKLDLEIGFKKAKQLSPWVIVEEQLIGSVYRITLIDNLVIAVLRRDPPLIIGDGLQTVHALFQTENLHPLRQGPDFQKIANDADANIELQRQNLTWRSIPERGQIITLNQKINWSCGGTTTDVTDQIHPDNIKLFKKIGAVINNPIIGLDFIIQDIGSSHTEQNHYGVIEANSLPLIENHHYPFNGRARDVAGAIWDMIFPASQKVPDTLK